MSHSTPEVPQPNTPGSTVLLRTFRGPRGASRVHGQLVAAGVEAELRETAGAIDLLVRREDEQRAREVLGTPGSFRLRPPGAEGPVSLAGVRSELTKLRAAKGSGLLTLVLTIGLFAALGLIGSSPAAIAVLVAVLLLHELGHFAGMKAFGYRDVKMFFIPFFGAAVSGRETSPSASRQAIVSLLGPAPGILLGIAAAVAFARTRSPLLASFASTSLALNTFNLLPFQPLDGGRVFEAALFSRHPWAEAIFRLLGAVALGALAWFAGSIGLGILALLMVSGLQFQWRIANIAQELRARFPPAPDAPEEVPDDRLEAIVAALDSRMPEAARRPRVFAVQADEIWRRMRSERCTAAAAVGFVAASVFLFVLGIAAAVALAILRKAPVA